MEKNYECERICRWLQNGKNLDAEDAFKMAMSSKVGDALENKRREVAGSLVSNHIPEVEEDEAV